MRNFEVLMAMVIPAESFAEAERIGQKIMSDSFEATKGEYPKRFMTYSIIKGELT